jgi:hypothetical protein
MSVTINASTSSGLVQTADTSGTVEIQSNGTTKLTVASTGAYGQLVSGTVNAGGANPLASVTVVDFTSLPSWVKRITVMYQGVSTNNTSDFWLRLGTSGGFATSGYVGYVARQAASSNSYTAWSSSAVLANGFLSSAVFSGVITIQLINSATNTWVISGQLVDSSTTGNFMNMAGYVPLSGALTQIRLTSATPDTFDAGTINIQYEG